jgi:geranylgeranyl pyrophosphate synthase
MARSNRSPKWLMQFPSNNFDEVKELFEAELKKDFPWTPGATALRALKLDEVIHYAFATGGKRIRALLVLASAIAECGDAKKALELAMPAALAVEFVHTYSLIHDDLPAMDNDHLRRGQPTVHVKFGEAVAILAGDALLADAFLHVAKASINAAGLCGELAQCAGRFGLVAGQVEDIDAATKPSFDRWLAINRAKTARLFESSAVMGAMSVGAPASSLLFWRSFGQSFGEAFQLADDLADNAGAAVAGTKNEALLHLAERLPLLSRQIKDARDNKLLLEIFDRTFSSFGR